MNCSALDLFSAFEDGEVGAIVTDPPETLAGAKQVVRESGRVLRAGGGLIVLGSHRSLRAWERLTSYANLHLMAELVVLWDSGKPRTRNFGSLHTRALWYAKGGHRYTFNFNLDPNQQIYSNILVCKRVPIPDRVHPSEKPVGLTNFLISLLTTSSDLVVDPFCGSGSTLVSAVHCGRSYVGCDIDPLATQVAQKRVMHADLEGPEPVYLWVNGVQHEV